MMSLRFGVSTLVAFLMVSSLEAFAPTPVQKSVIHNSMPGSQFVDNESRSTALFAGFGAAGGKKKKEIKLKPKAQWDRFLDMKKEAKIRVAVRVSEDDEWLAVGSVKSKDDKLTEVAVFRQRALIAEHARRLFPLKISQKDTVTWALWDEDADEWKTVEKSVMDTADIPSGLEKLIGFEGRPDPSSGYYCVYNEGRLVNEGDEARPSSKKLK